MKRFFVSWEIELDAEDPRDAAKQALAMQRDPDSTAQVFTCTAEGEEPVQVDLWNDTRTVQNSEPWCPECKCVVEAVVVLNGEEIVIGKDGKATGFYADGTRGVPDEIMALANDCEEADCRVCGTPVEWQDSDVSHSEEDGYQGPGVGSNV